MSLQALKKKWKTGQWKERTFLVSWIFRFSFISFIYITCLNVLYDMIGNGFQSFMVLITPGFWFRSLVYMYPLSYYCCFWSNSRIVQRLFFGWLAFLFFIYMLSNYALRAFDMVIFTMPLWLWLIVQIVLLVGSYYYIKKRIWFSFWENLIMDKIVILILVAAFGIIFALVPSRTYNILTKTLSFDKRNTLYTKKTW